MIGSLWMNWICLTRAADGENSERPQSLLRRWHTTLKKMSRYNYSDKLSQIIIGWNRKKAHAMPGIDCAYKEGQGNRTVGEFHGLIVGGGASLIAQASLRGVSRAACVINSKSSTSN